MEIEIKDLLELSKKQIYDAGKAVDLSIESCNITHDYIRAFQNIDSDLKLILGEFYDKYLKKIDYLKPCKNGLPIILEILRRAVFAKKII